MRFSQLKVVGAFCFVWILFMIACYLVLTLFFYSSLLMLGFFSLNKIFLFGGPIKELIKQLSFYEICLFLLKKAYSLFSSWEVKQRADLRPEYEKIFDASFNHLRREYMGEPPNKKNLTQYD